MMNVFTLHFQKRVSFFVDANKKVDTYVVQQAAIQQILKPTGHAEKAYSYKTFLRSKKIRRI
jgi:hypothetical protein